MSEPTILAIEIELPIRIRSEANLRYSHWAQRAQAAKTQRELAGYCVQSETNKRSWPGWPNSEHELIVTLIRIAPRGLDDDNLVRAFKAIRDGVADALGIDDGSKRARWFYRQRPGGTREYSALVRIEWRPVITPEMGRNMDCPFPPDPDL